MEDIIITLLLDDDTEMECVILTIFEAAGRDYVALMPVDEEDESVFIYR